MKRLTALGTTALFAASVLPASALPGHAVRRAASSTTALGMVATLTKAFPTGVVRDMGIASASTPMSVTVSLYTRNDAMVNAILAAENRPGNPQYHHYLTAAQSEALFSPSNASVAAVESYLASEGFTGIFATPDNELVHANGTVASVNAAFQTAEHVAQLGTKAVLINAQPAVVPAALSSVVRAVAGVSTVPMTSFLKKRPAGASCVSVGVVTGDCVLNDFTPRAFWVAYDAGGTAQPTDGSQTADFHSGINTPIAIFGEGILSGVTADLRTQENLYNLPQTAFSVINETGNPVQTDTSGSDEFDLDTQTSSGVAGNVKHLDIFDAASLNDSDLEIIFDQFKTLDTDKAGSASFGGCTSLEAATGALSIYDAIFAQAATQGQTVFASSGDTGAACEGAANGAPAGVPGAEFPASSEFVIGVGGTSLFTLPSNLYQGEITWFSGGGGLEPFETNPPWVTSSVDPFSTSGIRSVPDIAMDADPNVSGADVTVGGATEIVGGTSLSSPLALAVWARIESNNGEQFGNAGPVLYKEFGDDFTGAQANRIGDFTETVGGFNDVITGENTGYAATPGYDLTTGLGSLDIALQIRDINN